MKENEQQFHVGKRILALGTVLAFIGHHWLLFSIMAGTLVILCTMRT